VTSSSRTQTLLIPHELPTLNEMLDAQAVVFKGGKRGVRRSKYTEMKKTATRQVAWLAKVFLKPVEIYPVSFGIHWVRTDRRTDKDNIAAAVKFIFDGLKEGGILTNDGWKQIENWTNSFDTDPDDPQVVVTIFEGDPDNGT
jgi:Holliday junction resolvase RusA-like endonuclease